MPNGLDGAEAVIEGLIAAAFPTTPLAWANVPFTAPTDAAWLRTTVQWGQGARASKPPPARQTVIGLVQVEVYTPQALGAGAARRLADQVRAVWNSQEVEGVRFGVPSGARETPPETPWYRRLVTTPVSVDELLG